MLRNIYSLTLILFMGLLAAAQSNGVLATSSLKSFTVSDLPLEIQKLWEGRSSSISEARKQLVDQMIAERLIEAEALSNKTTPDKLISVEKAKAAIPAEEQINAVYEANKEALSNHSPTDARKQIIAFLRRQSEDALLKSYVSKLAAKYKVVKGKDINTPGLVQSDVIFSVNGNPATLGQFEDKYRLVLFDQRAEIFDRVADELDNVIYSTLVKEEARLQNVDPSSLLAREITNKLREFSDEERDTLESSFRSRLYSKYNAKVLITPPVPIVQNISADDDPARGPAAAPVTVVMFSDFQCPACSATHPVLKQVIARYADKVRFVVRDFPLTGIHDNALQAAKAAGAANAQGKFFEFIEILYARQDALDTDSLKKYAAELGLNTKQFELDLASEKTAAEIQKDISDGQQYGVGGTPSIFVNGIKVRRLSAGGLRSAIEAALKK